MYAVKATLAGLPALWVTLYTSYAACASFSPDAFAIDQLPDGVYILESRFTLIAPDAPARGDLSIWVGLVTKEYLVQTITDNSAQGPSGNPCFSKSANDWCIFAYAYSSSKGGTGSDDYAVARPGDRVTSHYVRNADEGIYEQTASVNGRVVSRWTSKSGLSKAIYTGVECCCDDPCGSVGAHDWVDVYIRFSKAVPDLESIARNDGAATHSRLQTSDGGITWALESIHIPGWTP